MISCLTLAVPHRALVAMAVILCYNAPAHSTLITHSLAGTISSEPGPLAPPFSLGGAFSGSFSYDSATPADFTSDGFAIYPALTRFSFEIDGYSVSFTGRASIMVENGIQGMDAFRINSIGPLSGVAINGFRPDAAAMALEDATASAFDSTALPANLSRDDFTSAVLALLFLRESPFLTIGFIAQGNLTTLERAPDSVAEPATLALVGLSLLSLPAIRKQRRCWSKPKSPFTHVACNPLHLWDRFMLLLLVADTLSLPPR
jgi:hypothetical protein